MISTQVARKPRVGGIQFKCFDRAALATDRSAPDSARPTSAANEEEFGCTRRRRNLSLGEMTPVSAGFCGVGLRGSPSCLRRRGVHERHIVPAGTRLNRLLFIGGRAVAADRDALRKRRISHILNMSEELDNFFEGDLTYRRPRRILPPRTTRLHGLSTS